MDRQAKEVIASGNYEKHLTEILDYGIETFGYFQARKYFHTVLQLVERLDTHYTYHPECRHLATSSRMYRNIILDSHLSIPAGSACLKS